VYFVFAIMAMAFSVAIAAAPIAQVFSDDVIITFGYAEYFLPLWTAPITIVTGIVMIVLTLHAARGIGLMHAQLAKHLLVRQAV
jgi:hypothetical protein